MSVYSPAQFRAVQNYNWGKTAAQKYINKKNYRIAQKGTLRNQEKPWKWTEWIQQWVLFNAGWNDQ
jgi:hypothetical protein